MLKCLITDDIDRNLTFSDKKRENRPFNVPRYDRNLIFKIGMKIALSLKIFKFPDFYIKYQIL